MNNYFPVLPVFSFQVISVVQRHGQTQVQWSILLDEAFHLEDVAKSQSSPVRHFTHSFPTAHHNSWMHRFYSPAVGEYHNLKCTHGKYFTYKIKVLPLEIFPFFET